jgi:hypothetical protein
VKVTFWFTAEGLGEETSMVAVAVAATVSGVDPRLVVKLLSPAYVTWME